MRAIRTSQIAHAEPARFSAHPHAVGGPRDHRAGLPAVRLLLHADPPRRLARHVGTAHARRHDQRSKCRAGRDLHRGDGAGRHAVPLRRQHARQWLRLQRAGALRRAARRLGQPAAHGGGNGHARLRARAPRRCIGRPGLLQHHRPAEFARRHLCGPEPLRACAGHRRHRTAGRHDQVLLGQPLHGRTPRGRGQQPAGSAHRTRCGRAERRCGSGRARSTGPPERRRPAWHSGAGPQHAARRRRPIAQFGTR